MIRIGTITVAALAWVQVAAAGPVWTVFSFSTTPQNAPKVLAAAEKLMASTLGQEYPGRLFLQANVANGSDPTTHSFVPIYKTAAEREAFLQKLQADEAWTAFQKTMTAESEPVAEVAYRVVKSWGDRADTDAVWMAHAFTVRDPAKMLAALEALMASPTGQKFPGQVYLSEVVAGGMSPVTHLISVGYASDTEMYEWLAVRDPSADWAAYLDASQAVSDYLGAGQARTMKTWGASQADIAGS